MTVRSGLDRWRLEGAGIAGLDGGDRIALLAHPASIDSGARHAVELLSEAGGPRLVRLFAPEHGLYGHEQDMETVGAAVDPASGLPVTSLYGDSPESLRPRAADLDGLDAVVVDLQDVGSRYYTFVYTMAYVMEAAAELDLGVVVLDRPNPIGGTRVEGPLLDPAFASFVGRFPLPVRHGMTPGELARMFNETCAIGCRLTVVPMRGWRREMQFEDTSLPWVAPSPNMPTPATARVYPGGCLVEGTNLSEGRGTTQPFELIGAPWLDAERFARALRERELPGALFRAASFRPMFQKHAGAGCRGVQLIVSDPADFMPFETFLAILVEARRQAPDEFDWRRETYEFESSRLAIDLLLGRGDLRPRLERGEPVSSLAESWREELAAFVERRRRWLLYS
jgi:uncharacterized protein YbbC (DUF1343 family)